MHDISVIIPAYNEEAIIAENVSQISDYLAATFPDLSYEIVVVDDGSTDSMPQVLAEFQKTHSWLRVVRYVPNRGRGMALRTGFQNADGKYVFTLDADLSYVPEHIKRMFDVLRRQEADIVLVSAYSKGGTVKNVPAGRAILSRVGNFILASALSHKVNTVTCVVRGYTRDALDHLILFSCNKDIHLEILQKAQIMGLRIAEVPGDLCWRTSKRGGKKRGMNFSNLFAMCKRHLFFNFLFRPGSLFWIPQLFIIAAFLISSITIIISYINALISAKACSFGDFYQILRTQMQNASISFWIAGISFIMILQFLSLYMISEQNNYHYEEMLRHMARIDEKLSPRQRKEE